MDHEKAILNLKKQLQKSFHALSEVIQIWTDSCDRCQPLLSTLSNRIDQYQCCVEAKLEDDPVAIAFPDLRDRLLCNIAGEIEEPIQCLGEEKEKLQATCDRLSKLNGQIRKQYTKLAPVTSLDALSTGTATCPPMADLMEWLMDMERILLQQYHYKTHLLESFCVSDPVATDRLVKQWSEGDCQTIDMVQDRIFQVSFFMDEKL